LSQDDFNLTKREVLDDLSIYPNPNNGEFYLGNIKSSELSRIEIFHLSGKLITSLPITEDMIDQNEEAFIKTKGLQAGVYILKIYTKENKATLIKLVIE